MDHFWFLKIHLLQCKNLISNQLKIIVTLMKQVTFVTITVRSILKTNTLMVLVFEFEKMGLRLKSVILRMDLLQVMDDSVCIQVLWLRVSLRMESRMDTCFDLRKETTRIMKIFNILKDFTEMDKKMDLVSWNSTIEPMKVSFQQINSMESVLTQIQEDLHTQVNLSTIVNKVLES